jgi:hypothetical protein
MPPTLPRAFHRILRDFGVFLIGFAALAACHHADPPVKPGPPLAAEPDIKVGTMDAECTGLTNAINTWSQCPNLEDGDRAWMKSLIEYADQVFAAGRAGKPDEDAQHAIAVACHRASVSITNANTRCLAGPRPRVD